MKNPMNNPSIEYGGVGGTSACHFPNNTANSSNNGIRCEVKWWTQLCQQLLTPIVESTPHSQADRTLEYGLLNQPITAHLVPERYNKMTSFLKLTFSWHMRKKKFQPTRSPILIPFLGVSRMFVHKNLTFAFELLKMINIKQWMVAFKII